MSLSCSQVDRLACPTAATSLSRPLQPRPRRIGQPAGRHQPTPRRIGVTASFRPWRVLVPKQQPAATAAEADVHDAKEGTDRGSTGNGSIGSGSSEAAMAGAVHDVSAVWENQRFFGLWKAPLSVLDSPEWSDAQGNPVALDRRPAEDPSAWEPVVGPATDAEGWQYATVFKHLEYKRPGGRAVRRFNDTVRRRLWRRRPGTSPEAAPAVAVPADAAGAPTATAGAAAAAAAVRGGGGTAAAASAASAAMAAAEAAREAREAEAKRQAIKGFISLVLDLLSRRQVWTLVPWDPAAVFLLYQKHQKIYQELQAQALHRRLFTADQEAPPSQLREGRTLLQDLLCAAMHSRAAYGYAAESGRMSTVADYIRLQTIQPLTFDAVGGVSVEANNESVAALAGIPVEDILLAEWRNSPYRPCHYVAIDRANQCIVVSIRGSLQIGDLLSDLHAAPMEVKIAGADGWVHQGIFSAATYIQCSTQEALQEAARRCPGWPVLLTGHSLGGGVAALLTLLFQEAGLPEGLGPVRSITVGTAAVMSRPLAEACNELVTSVILGSDAVPHLSVASVEALLLEASEASPVRRTVQDWGSKLSGVLTKGMAMQQETVAAAAAALSGAKSGNWQAVKQASQRITQSASGIGLNRIASLVAGQSGGNGSGGAQQQQQGVRSIPVIEQPPAAQQQQQQQQGQGQPRHIPVIDLSRQQAGAAPVAAAGARSALGVQGPGDSRAVGLAPAAEGMDASPAEQAVERQQQQGQQAQQQQGQQGEEEAQAMQTDVLLPMADFDSPAVEAKQAQDAAAGRGLSVLGSSGGVQDPGDPELLYPPGRIIWIFPSEEHLLVPAEADQQLQAMDAAWQGAADPMDGEDAPHGQGQAQEHRHEPAANDGQRQGKAPAPAGADEPAAAGSPPGGTARGRHDLTNEDAAVQGHGSVNVGEAEEALQTGHALSSGDGGGSGSSSEPTGGAAQGEDGARQVPVVVDADRSCFERLLLMPDMLNDHLPDRIVAALQQL